MNRLFRWLAELFGATPAMSPEEAKKQLALLEGQMIQWWTAPLPPIATPPAVQPLLESGETIYAAAEAKYRPGGGTDILPCYLAVTDRRVLIMIGNRLLSFLLDAEAKASLALARDGFSVRWRGQKHVFVTGGASAGLTIMRILNGQIDGVDEATARKFTDSIG